jgi:hypothetical protein
VKRSPEHERGALCERSFDGYRCDALLGGHRLAGQERFVDGETFGAHKAPVGWDSFALTKNDQVSGHNLFGRDLALSALSNDARAFLERLPQRENGELGARFLHKAEQSVQEHDYGDRCGLDLLPHQERDRARGD